MNLFNKLTAPNISKLEEKKDKEGLKNALTHKDSSIRLAALQALARLGDIGTVYSVYKECADDRALQEAALDCIQNFSDHELNRVVSILVQKSRGSDVDMAKDVARITGARMMPLILKQYYGEIRNRSVYWLSGVIEDVGVAAIDPLIAACNETLAGPNSSWTSNMVEALGRLRDPRVKDYMIGLLESPNTSSSRAAIDSLAAIKDRRAVEPLIRILEDQTKESQLRASAAYALGETCDDRAFDALLAALQDEKWMVQEKAAAALSKVNPDRLQTVASRYLADLSSLDRVIRQSAIHMLKNLKIPSSFEPLAGLLNDADDSVCEAASAAVKSIDTKRAAAAID
ncbi:MAG TPA: HEAT repeat domain-containing protein, partial [Anaerolineaceae bacterium]|nr:HEAT repeat domain-containing protein [Anaerolineaceae bacterium]